MMVGDQVVGGIGVSGAASAQQDEEIAIAGANALQMMKHSAMRMPSPEITYLEGPKVAAAFAKGSPLVELNAYKIHASRREAPGMAEVHERDTDIIYVLDGSATIVTGGTIPDAATTAPEELRGSSIRDGQTRRLSKGDFMIVPNGTPHWFEQVQGPFTYYVVKVRSQM
jgi:glc operon protein GlcG